MENELLREKIAEIIYDCKKHNILPGVCADQILSLLPTQEVLSGRKCEHFWVSYPPNTQEFCSKCCIPKPVEENKPIWGAEYCCCNTAHKQGKKCPIHEGDENDKPTPAKLPAEIDLKISYSFETLILAEKINALLAWAREREKGKRWRI